MNNKGFQDNIDIQSTNSSRVIEFNTPCRPLEINSNVNASQNAKTKRWPFIDIPCSIQNLHSQFNAANGML